MQIILKEFSQLTANELYAILQLRIEVFVVEQNCVYQDLDNKDQVSHHLCIWNDNHELIATCRIVPRTISYHDYVSIGRVVTRLDVRKHGYGKILMVEAIKTCKTLFTHEKIKISAQSYLLKFYSELGFESTGEEYLEDGIPHTAMVYRA